MNLRRSALALTTMALAASALAAPAQAATPENGKISIYQPRIEWTGEAMGSAVQYAHYFYGGQIVDECEPPICDSFTLTVEQAAEKLEIVAEDSTGYTEVQIKDAAGNEIFWSEGDAAGPTVYEAYDVEPGTYTVEVLTDSLAPEIDDASYSAYAQLNDGVPVPVS